MFLKKKNTDNIWELVGLLFYSEEPIWCKKPFHPIIHAKSAESQQMSWKSCLFSVIRVFSDVDSLSRPLLLSIGNSQLLLV